MANKQPIQVIADDREVAGGVVEALRRQPDCRVEIKRLRLGDYQVGGRLLFERKTLRDMVVSIIDGRFLAQVCRLARGTLRPVIILEGTARDLGDSGMSREAVQGALITATVVLGIPLLRSRDSVESAKLMLFSARQLSAVVTGALPRVGSRPKSKRALQLHILQGLPHIGPVRAARLIDAFGTVERTISAPAGQLSQVEGLGPTLARKIRWSVDEPTVHYAASSAPET
jgi:ERCC4-type nuclease